MRDALNRPPTVRLIAVAALAVALALGYAVARASDWSAPVITDAGTVELDAAAFGGHELSGLTWAGPVEGKPDTHRFLALSDGNRELYTLHIALKPDSGAVASCAVVSSITLAAGTDLEGVAWSGPESTVFTCDESGSRIREHYAADSNGNKAGSLIREEALPPPFQQARPNLGLESLARADGDGALWTANEEALPGDGQPANSDAGSLVRLVRLGRDLKPDQQWAYLTDPVSANPPRNARRERSGVADIAVLPDGSLLVLERMLDVERFIFADIPHFRSRLYHVNPSVAGPESRFEGGLSGRAVKPLAKRLLWEGKFGVEKPCNFEGIALGPELSGGAYSLVLVSDDENGSLLRRLQALRIQPGARLPIHIR